MKEHDVSRSDVHVQDGHVLSWRAYSLSRVHCIDLFREGRLHAQSSFFVVYVCPQAKGGCRDVRRFCFYPVEPESNVRQVRRNPAGASAQTQNHSED